MEILYSSKFGREYKRLTLAQKRLAEARENIFRKNPYDPRLKTHQLTGKIKEYWAFSIDRKLRIIFEFYDNKTVWFHSVGSHDIYK